MSHAVTITRTTTTTTSTSALILNTGYLKTVPGILKLAQLILGGIVVFFISWNFWKDSWHSNSVLFFLCMAVAFFIGTFCLLVSCLVSLSTGGIISKTIYELVYHSVAFILYLVSSILLVSLASDYRRDVSHPHMFCSILGLVLAVLYLVSAVFAQRSYRGI